METTESYKIRQKFLKISRWFYKKLTYWVERNLQVFCPFLKIKNEDVIIIKLERFFEKDAYIMALMLVTVPLAGELKFYPLNEEFRISFGAPAFSFLSAAAACVRCIAGIFDWNIGFRISCFIGIMGRKTRRADSNPV